MLIYEGHHVLSTTYWIFLPKIVRKPKTLYVVIKLWKVINLNHQDPLDFA